MRAVRYHETGAPDVLTVGDIDRPQAGCNDVLVDVRAASVNPVDVARTYSLADAADAQRALVEES